MGTPHATYADGAGDWAYFSVRVLPDAASGFVAESIGDGGPVSETRGVGHHAIVDANPSRRYSMTLTDGVNLYAIDGEFAVAVATLIGTSPSP